MKNKEAIKELNEVKLYFDADDKIQQALTLAIQSLEGQISNKLRYTCNERTRQTIPNKGVLPVL